MTRPRSQLRRRLRLCGSLGGLVLLGLASGCQTGRLSDPVIGTGYRPANVYLSLPRLPGHIRRVAVLPTTRNARPADLEPGRARLEAIIIEELGQTKKFELVAITPGQLRAWTGRSSWPAEESLPAALLPILKEQAQCDAVLFSRLTQYRAYPPLAVGFSFKLVDLANAGFLWAADEVFDASEPGVVTAARRYQLNRESLPASLADSRSILNSPSGFARYAAASVFQTLPAR